MNGVAAWLSAVCVSVITAAALAFPFGGLNPAIAAAALGAGAAAGIFQYGAGRLRQGQAAPGRKITGWEWAVIVIYTLYSLRAFCWLVYWNETKIQFLSPNNIGDL